MEQIQHYTTFSGVCTDYFLDSVWVQPPYKFQAHTTPDTFVCPNDSFSIIASPINGAAPYTYKWQPVNITTPQFVTALTGNTTYTLQAHDSSQCVFFDTVKIYVHKLQAVHFSFPDDICGNDSPFTLQASPQGGNWFGSPALVAPNIFIPKNAGIGTHNLSYQAKDSNNCVVNKTDTITVEPYSVPAFYVTPTHGHIPLPVDFVSQASPKPLANWWFIENVISGKTDTVVTADSVLHYTFTDSGVFNITLTPVLGWCTEALTKTNYVVVGAITGNVTTPKSSYAIWPNPINKGEALTLEGVGVSVVLYDAVGRKIDIAARPAGEQKTQVDTQNLAPGLYWLYIFIENLPAGSAKLIIKP